MGRRFLEASLPLPFAVGAILGITLAFYGLSGWGPCGPSTFLAEALVTPGMQICVTLGDGAWMGGLCLLAIQGLTGGLGVALAHRILFGTCWH